MTYKTKNFNETVKVVFHLIILLVTIILITDCLRQYQLDEDAEKLSIKASEYIPFNIMVVLNSGLDRFYLPDRTIQFFVELFMLPLKFHFFLLFLSNKKSKIFFETFLFNDFYANRIVFAPQSIYSGNASIKIEIHSV